MTTPLKGGVDTGPRARLPSLMEVFMKFGLVALLALAACSGTDASVPKSTDGGGGLDQDDDGFSIGQGDCDDNNADAYPGANDVVGDDLDLNCDDIDGVDDDGDKQASQGSGGTDCNDNDDTIYLGAPEVGWDGIDQDCDDVDRYDFVLVAAGQSHTCGLTTIGSIECFGDDTYTQVSGRPAGTNFVSLDAGADFTCSVDEEGGAFCWGRDENSDEKISGLLSPPEGDWAQVSLSSYFGCLVDREGYTTCWGDDEYGQVSGAPTQTAFTTLAVGAQHACGIRRNGGGISCWGSDTSNQIAFAPTDAGYLRIASGTGHTCAVRSDQGMRCWGEDNQEQTEPDSDAGPYNWVTSSKNTTCGIISNRELTCWGEDALGTISMAPTSDDFTRVEVGASHACAIQSLTDELTCWGKNTEGQATVPWP